MKLSKSQIKQIIEKLMIISKSNSGTIPATNISDVSNIVAYLEGFSSWNHYLEHKSKDTFKYKKFSDFNFTHKDESTMNEEISISLLSSADFRKRLFSYRENSNESTFAENRQILSKLEIGKNFNKITKSNEQFYLIPENTGFIGETKKIREKVSFQLMEQNQTLIEFSDSKNDEKLDLINEIFNTDMFDVFFDTQEHNHKDFLFVWSLIIKQIAKQFNIKYELNIILETLTLDFLFNIWGILSEDGNFISSILISYLKGLGEININEKRINISNEAIIRHNKNISKLYSLFIEVQESYDKGIFSKNKKVLDFMMDKKSAIFSIPSKEDFKYVEVINGIVKFSTEKYNELSKGKNEKEHLIFILNYAKNLDKTFIDCKYTTMFNFLSVEDYYSINNVDQIVFSKHKSFIQPNDNFLINFYLNTKFEENIFLNSGEILLDLNENNFYLWQQTKNTKELIKLIL